MATTAVPPARIPALDIVRGVAVMGILLLNIVAFGLPDAAYFNPRAFGGAEGVDLWVYLVNFVLFDGKMRGLFTFLFGASTLLVIERAEARGVSAARVHFARNLWLLAFGLAHLWLLWWGDILNLYAMVALIAWFFRDMRVSRLIGLGLALVALQFFIMAFIPLGVWSAQSGTGGSNAAAELAQMQQAFGVPDAAAIREQLARYRGSWSAIAEHRFATYGMGQLAALGMIGAETLAYMLFGMAALRTGLFAGSWPRSRYIRWIAIGFGIGIPAYCALAWWLVSSDFDLLAVTAGVMWLPTLVRPVMVVAWACLIILLLARAEPGALTTRIAAAGRMAFTNYLVTTILCTHFFYGYGFGWFGYLSRAELYVVVVIVWAFMLLWSKPWLSHFRYGPFEWLWRSLSRGRLQPLRGSAFDADRARTAPVATHMQ